MKGNAGFRSLMVLLALVLLIQVPAAWAVGDSENAGLPLESASPDAPIIVIWYGSTQNFGVLGDPQRDINVLGNVTSATSLEYSLNGGPPVQLTIGTGGSTPAPLSADVLHADDATAAGNKRLVNKGDFNAEIPISDLLAGANTVEITAYGNGQTTETVTVNYGGGKTWPMPYTLDWNDYDDLEDALQGGNVQVVDGEWYLFEDDGEKWLRPIETAIGYDRAVAIGGIQWQNYDILVPIWLKLFPIENVGNIGLMVRWQGHIEKDPGEQPLTGWWESGVFGIYRHYSQVLPDDPTPRLEMFYGRRSKLVDESGFSVKRKEPYWWRLRVQTTESAPYGLFSMKVWKSSDPEPSDWVFEVADEMPEALDTGSFLLVAHESDAQFGKVEVKPLVKLQTAANGPGTVQASPELNSPSDAYLLGDTVELTAVPDDPANFAFAGWSGDLTGADNPASLTLDKAVTQVTATFAPKRTLTTSVDPAGAGQVLLDPPGGVYGNGTVVKLTPKSNANWSFDRWSGPNQSDLVSLGDGSWSIMMNADKSVTANFVPGYALDITTTGQGTVITNPPGTGFPQGTVVTLTAKPDWGWFFSSWQGDLTGWENPATLTMDANKAVQAIFIEANQAFLPVVVKRSR
jgi:hypothetical protein